MKILLSCLPLLLTQCVAIRGQLEYTTARGNTVSLASDGKEVVVGARIDSLANDGGLRK